MSVVTLRPVHSATLDEITQRFGQETQLVEVVFFDAVRRVGDDCVNAVLNYSAHPFEAVGMNKDRVADGVGIVVESK